MINDEWFYICWKFFQPLTTGLCQGPVLTHKQQMLKHRRGCFCKCIYNQYTLTKNEPGVFVTRTVSPLLLETSLRVLFVCLRRRSVIEAVYNKLNPHKEEEGVSWSLFEPPRPSAFQSTHPAPLSASSSPSPQRDLINTRQPGRGRSCMNVRNGVKEGGG